MGKQIFLSYKSEDRDLVLKIKQAIEEAGYSCWMAPFSIPGGSSYAAEIENAIRDCNALVLVFTEAAMNSKWVEKEVDRAMNQNKLILPLRMEEFDLNSSFSYYLTNVQFYDAFLDYDFALSQIIKRIKECFEPDLPADGFGSVIPVHKDKKDDTPVSESDEAAADAAGAAAAEIPAAAVGTRKEKIKPEKKKKEKKPVKEKKVKEKKPKGKKAEKQGAGGAKKKGSVIKKILIILAAVFLMLVLAVVVINLADDSGNFVIAGKEYNYFNCELEISDYKLTSKDIKNINRLTRLEKIKLNNCGLTDYDVKQLNVFKSDYTASKQNNGVCHLKEVDLSGNPGITDLRFLENAQHINYLNISDTGIRDFNGLTENFSIENDYYKYKQLIADGCEFTSLDGLEKIKPNGSDFEISLRNCNLNNEKIQPIGRILQNNVPCISLMIDDNPAITDLSFLSECEGIKNLSVSNTGITDFKGVEKLIYLERVLADNCKITKLDGLENTTVLNWVSLSGNSINDISVLDQSASTIGGLYIAGSKINGASINAIKDMNSLTELDMEDCGIGDASFLEGKSGITWLNLSNNSLTGFDCLKSLNSLAYLDLYGNQLTSFDFADLPDSIKVLNLSGNNIVADGIAITEGVELESMDLHGSEYRSITIAVHCKNLTLDYYETVDYSNFTGFTELNLIDCPLNKRVEMNGYFGDKLNYVSGEEYENTLSQTIKENKGTF